MPGDEIEMEQAAPISKRQNEDEELHPGTKVDTETPLEKKPEDVKLETKEKEKTPAAAQPKKSGGNCYWIFMSLLAGACMGIGNFLFASNFSGRGLLGLGVLGPGGTILCLLIRIIKESIFRVKQGKWIKDKNSRVKNEDGSIKWKSLIPLIANVATNFIYLVVLTIGWKLAKASGLNQGVIAAMINLASLFNIVIFYFKFGEKISALHAIGIVFSISCVVCISVAAANTNEESIGEAYNPDKAWGMAQHAAGILGVACGIMAAICMSTKHVFIKLYKSFYSGVDLGVDATIFEFLICTFFLIPLLQEPDFEYGQKEIIVGSIAGMLVALGRVFISIGVSEGLAAPAQALMSTHALWQAGWSAAVAGQALSLLQILGLILGVIGVFSISFLDALVSKYCKKQDDEKKPQPAK